MYNRKKPPLACSRFYLKIYIITKTDLFFKRGAAKIACMATKIYLTSFKGGTGVTAFCIGLGLALAELGERTLIVDGDTLSGGAILAGGLSNMQVYTLADYEKGACRAKQTLIPHAQTANLCFMPSIGLKNAEAANRAVADVEGLFDFILADKTAKESCDRAIIVTEPFLPSVKSADCCRNALADGGFKDIGLVVNKICGGQILNGEIMTAQEIAAVLHLPLTAVIPEDLTLSAGKYRNATIKAFKLAAAAVCGKKEGTCNVIAKYAGLGGYIKRKLREKV